MKMVLPPIVKPLCNYCKVDTQMFFVSRSTYQELYECEVCMKFTILYKEPMESYSSLDEELPLEYFEVTHSKY